MSYELHPRNPNKTNNLKFHLVMAGIFASGMAVVGLEAAYDMAQYHVTLPQALVGNIVGFTATNFLLLTPPIMEGFYWGKKLQDRRTRRGL